MDGLFVNLCYHADNSRRTIILTKKTLLVPGWEHVRQGLLVQDQIVSFQDILARRQSNESLNTTSLVDNTCNKVGLGKVHHNHLKLKMNYSRLRIKHTK